MRLPLNARRSLASLSIALVSVVFVSACSEPAAPPAPPAPAVKTSQERAKFYTDCWNHFNNQAWDSFKNCYDANVVSETPDGTPASITGRDAVIERAKLEAAGFSDRKGEVRLVLVNGDHIAAIAQYGGTNSGPMPGPDGKPVPATNKPIGLLIAHSIDMDASGTAAIREAAYIEGGTVAGQMGLQPGPVRPVEKPIGAAPLIVLARNDSTESANLATFRASLDAFNKHDLKAYEAFLADNYKGIEAARPTDLNKKESLASAKEMFGAFPDVKITPTTSWAAGDYVVVFGTFEGTNTGDWPSMQMKKTGKKVVGRFCEIFKIEGGKITEDYLFFNGAAFMAQLTAK